MNIAKNDYCISTAWKNHVNITADKFISQTSASGYNAIILTGLPVLDSSKCFYCVYSSLDIRFFFDVLLGGREKATRLPVGLLHQTS